MIMESFRFYQLDLEGAVLIKVFHAEDNRGELVKDFNCEIFRDNGIEYNLKETFYTVSKRGVIRAVHFQLDKQQAKLVRCISGKIYDVIVDLRPNSPTFGQWRGFYLSSSNYCELLIPEFFGHGYLVIEDSVVSYKCANVFYSPGDSGIMYDDRQININWPLDEVGGIRNVIMSEKDKHLMSFEEYKKYFNR